MNTTTNLAEFGARERRLVIDLLTAWEKHGLPSDFWDDEVVPMMNTSSGNVFLTNSEFEVAMMNGDKLESYYNSPIDGQEGFFNDLLADYTNNMDEETREWLRGIAKNIGRLSDLPTITEG